MKGRPVRRFVTAGLAAAASAALLASCAVGSGEPAPEKTPAETALDSLSTPLEPLWVAPTTGFASAPIIVGDVVVTYEQTPETPFALSGYSVETGERVWSLPSSPGSIESGSPLTVMRTATPEGDPLLISVSVPALQPDQRYAHTVRFVDPDDGRVVLEGPPQWVGSPGSCATGGACYLVWDEARQSWVRTQLALDGTVTSGRGIGLPATDVGVIGRSFGREVYLAVDDAGAQSIVRVGDDGQQWAHPVSQLWGEGATLDNVPAGYLYFDEGPTIVVTAVPRPAQEEGGFSAHDYVAVGFDYDTGEVLWTREGLAPCHEDLFCSGDAAYRPRPDSTTQLDLDLAGGALTRIDPRTGETEWEITGELGGVGNRKQDGGFVAPPGVLAYTDGGVPHVLDTATGETRELADDDLVGCFQTSGPFYPESSDPYNQNVRYTGGALVRGCGIDGEVDDPRQYTVGVVGVGSGRWDPAGDGEDDGLRALQTRKGLALFQL
ncbi:hypothetical protein [Microbacterium lushaniae]|uniref:Uncharacterized protein n=1 Tax=Microbacterium lushaniae TaxID=2614639 RepID=A0A5J6L0Z3_9MICO|nr:hypothetical protein [Microbacterium lushaniae]QEW02163.1 hypothetical protein F6J85_02975 [Microbacterium lushaniae]